MNNTIFKVLLYLGLIILLPSCIDSDNDPVDNNHTDPEPSWVKTTKIELDISNFEEPTIAYTKTDTYNEDSQKTGSTSSNTDNVYMFTYNAEGLLSEKTLELSDGTLIQTIYTYNDDQQLTREAKAINDTPTTHTDYAYDLDNRISTITLSSGTSYTFEYHEDGSSTKVNDQSGDFSSFKVDAFNNYTNISSYTAGQTEGVDTPVNTLKYIYSEDGMLLFEINSKNGASSYAANYIYEYKGEHKTGLTLENWIWATKH